MDKPTGYLLVPGLVSCPTNMVQMNRRHRSGLVVPGTREFWTRASAGTLCWPSVIVQVFRMYAGIVYFQKTSGSHRVKGYCGNSFQVPMKSKGRGSKIG